MQSKTFAQCRTKYTLRRNQSHQVPPTPNPSLKSSPPSENKEDHKNFNTQKINTPYQRKNSETSHCSHTKDFDSNNLLCQDCINKALMEEKYLSFKKQKNDDPISPFEDKLRSHYSNYYNSKVKNREMQSQQVMDSLSRFKYNGKNEFITNQENSCNSFNNVNSNYLYERAKKNQAERDKIIQDNIEKFKNKERPEITAYFNHYINNSDGQKSFLLTQYENEQKQQVENYKNYKRALLEQIEYKQNIEKAKNEQEAKIAQEQYERVQKEIEKETYQKLLHDKQLKDELLNGNLKLINEKMKRKIDEDNETQIYNGLYKKEFEEEKQREEQELLNNKLKMSELLKDNLYYMEKEREKRQKQKDEEQNYQYNINFLKHKPEEMGECMNCHRTFPRRLLTINRAFYSNNRK